MGGGWRGPAGGMWEPGRSPAQAAPGRVGGARAPCASSGAVAAGLTEMGPRSRWASGPAEKTAAEGPTDAYSPRSERASVAVFRGRARSLCGVGAGLQKDPPGGLVLAK